MKRPLILFFFLISATCVFPQQVDQKKLNQLIHHIETNKQDIGAVSIFRTEKKYVNATSVITQYLICNGTGTKISYRIHYKGFHGRAYPEADRRTITYPDR